MNCNHEEKVRFSVPFPLLRHDMKLILRVTLGVQDNEFCEYTHARDDRRGPAFEYLRIICRLDQFARLAVACMRSGAPVAEGFTKFKPEVVPSRELTSLDVSNR